MQILNLIGIFVLINIISCYKHTFKYKNHLKKHQKTLFKIKHRKHSYKNHYHAHIHSHAHSHTHHKFRQEPQNSAEQPAQEDLQPGEVPDNFEEMELMDAMPPTFFRDACCLADEGQTCTIECQNDHCYKGVIKYIYTGYYGSIEGECPNFAHTWKCVKEVHGILAENDQEKYQCVGKDKCEISVSGEDYETVDWTTWVVNGQDSPDINHHPEMHSCGLVEPKKLAVIANCECSNPVHKQIHGDSEKGEQ